MELIEEVGHAGNYLTHPSTFKHCGDAMSPKLMNRESYARWASRGESNLHERALEKARNVVENHHPAPISRQAQKEIDEIICETEKELGVIT